MKKLSMKIYKPMNQNKLNILFTIIFIFLVIFAVVLITMLCWSFIASLKSAKDYRVNKLGFPNLDPSDIKNSIDSCLHFSNYGKVISSFNYTESSHWYSMGTEVRASEEITFFVLLRNTLIYAIGGGLIYAVMPAIVAYLCAKYNYWFSKVMFTIYTVMMCVPIIGNLPSELTFLRDSGLYNEFWGNFIQKMSGSGMYFFVYYAFFKSSSDTYREAAEIDGASEASIMFKVYFPLAKKMIATVFLIQFVSLWNDYQTPMLYLPTKPTLAYGLYRLTYQQSISIPELTEIPAQMAAALLIAIPVFVIFIIFKDKIMGDISLGGIKE